MKVILKTVSNKTSRITDEPVVYKPKTQIQLEKVLRDLWEKEYNSYDPDPDNELSYFEEDYCRIENEIRVTEFKVLNLIETEV